MALHDEEMNKRREKREAQRKRQQAQMRRMRRTAVLAALVLIVCGVGIWRLTRQSQSSQEPSQQSAVQTEATEEATKATSPLQRNPITTVHLRAAGDLNVTDSVISAGVAVSGYDYSGVFKDVSSVLSDADLTVLNFEGNIYGQPYGSATTSAPYELLESLRRCGVDLIQMANSCTINNGLNGLTATLQSIRSAGMEPVGAFASEAEFNKAKGYTITEAQGIKIAFVAFTKGLGGRGLPAGNEHLVNLLYEDYDSTYETLDKDQIETILRNVQAEKPDIVVALVHWGSEYNEYSEDTSRSQNSLITLMQKYGVDIILGTHPHTLQPIVFDKAKGTLVAYSLGDFFGDASRGGTNYSIILDVEITKDTTSGTTKVTGYSYTPIYTVTESEAPDKKRRVVRIEEALDAYEGNYLDKVTATCKDSMEYALQRIKERIALPVEEDDK